MGKRSFVLSSKVENKDKSGLVAFSFWERTVLTLLWTKPRDLAQTHVSEHLVTSVG